jgi:hypothetical protein
MEIKELSYSIENERQDCPVCQIPVFKFVYKSKSALPPGVKLPDRVMRDAKYPGDTPCGCWSTADFAAWNLKRKGLEDSERWKWAAVYKDGSRVVQGDINPGTGKPWSIGVWANRSWAPGDLDLKGLQAILFIPLVDSAPRVLLQVRDGDTPIRFVQRYQAALTGEQWCSWVLGVQRGQEMFFTYLNQDGSVYLTSEMRVGIDVGEEVWRLPQQ